MSKEDQIESIIEELGNLQIRQKVLIAKLGQLARSENTPARAGTSRKNGEDFLPTAATIERDSEFAVGDRVRIKNPGPFQPTTGTVSKIGAKRITVRTANGSNIVRAPKNLTFQ